VCELDVNYLMLSGRMFLVLLPDIAHVSSYVQNMYISNHTRSLCSIQLMYKVQKNEILLATVQAENIIKCDK
jgi:hypothetical protein